MTSMKLTIASVVIALSCFSNLSEAQQAPVWGQCGGRNYAGPTECAPESTCKFINDWYSQCIPSPITNPTPTSSIKPSTSATTTVPPVSTSTPTPTPILPTGLHRLAKARGNRYFGSATDNAAGHDATYRNLLSDTAEFGSITVGNAMKWDATEAERGVFTFARADSDLAFGESNRQMVRGHTLLWHSQLPSWVSSGNFNATTLTSIIEKHVTTLVSRWKGRLAHWDVVNEVLNEDGTFRPSVFYTTLGENFISIAFRAARRADPNAKLYLNDYNIEGAGAKSDATYNLVKRLKAQGVPIDGIGMQAHLILGSVPSTMQATIAKFASLGVDVAITELDIRMKTPSDVAKLKQQEADYYAVTKACVNVPRCVGITVWDFSDGHSWIPSVFPGEGAALPWDENFVKKPAYNGIASAFKL